MNIIEAMKSNSAAADEQAEREDRAELDMEYRLI